MNITAITRYKHGNIYKLLQKLGWTQSELAKRSKLCISVVGKIINLSRRPNEDQANAIQRAFGEAGEYLDVLEEWPEAFRLDQGFKREETAEIPVGNLLYSKEMLDLEFKSTAAPKEMVDSLEDAMEDLLPRERKVIEDFMDGRTLAEAGKKIGVCRNHARQIQMKVLRKLRHPSRIQKLNCDLVDQVIEQERKWAKAEAERRKQEVAEAVKRAEEQREKDRIKREETEATLRAAREAHKEGFRMVGRVFYDDLYRKRYIIFSTKNEILTEKQEEVADFIRKFIDPEWRGTYADYSITHPTPP